MKYQGGDKNVFKKPTFRKDSVAMCDTILVGRSVIIIIICKILASKRAQQN